MVKNIIVVDDNPNIIYSVKYGLEDIDPEYRVTSAENGKKLFEILNTNYDFDVILLDIMMPEMNGWEVAAKIKENPQWKSIPIVFLTAKGDPMSKGMGEMISEDYVVKPFEITDLKNRIDKVLEKNKS